MNLFFSRVTKFYFLNEGHARTYIYNTNKNKYNKVTTNKHKHKLDAKKKNHIKNQLKWAPTKIDNIFGHVWNLYTCRNAAICFFLLECLLSISVENASLIAPHGAFVATLAQWALKNN